ncbi:GspH/FimT family pseudopilin [Methyloversatilis sp.]|uniref:GspH/FimT family pseudopilin n=1 Tax=Methyloversatilis sp. TaxID=2569862 RepID=UPI0035B1AC0E
MGRPRLPQHGFSLIELMIVVLLLAIVSAFAMPAFQSFIASSRLTSEANEVLAALNLARSEAVRVQRRVVLCRAAQTNGQVVPSATSGCVTTTTSQPWQGWFVFVDNDADGVFDVGETVIRTQTLTAGGLVIVSNSALGTAGNRIIFRPDGLARAQDSVALQNAEFVVCDTSGALSGANARTITLLSGSRMNVTRTTSANCGISIEEPSEEEGSAEEET